MTTYSRSLLPALAALAAWSLSPTPGHAAQQPPPPRSAAPQHKPLPQDKNQVAHSGVIPPPATGDTGINKGAPPVKDFPTPVIHPPANPAPPSP